ncbi:uncharacterized protein JN550_008356 [Neoarthrinium moseri]|uniref:uncharacterized protein n=1 Tax=Neoarthrinium moseri TaxID=1658444 RepID=UPI001FDC5B47|nr:uncharacterized protein JN550_008356 [Neoarthrinium moseri]KAI1865308.1 hypothetical protein JN550_008356 [Neoarthrinium moseri]
MITQSSIQPALGSTPDSSVDGLPSNVATPPSACDLCERLLQLFNESSTIRCFDLGPLDSAILTDCPIHKRLLESYISRCIQNDPDPAHWGDDVTFTTQGNVVEVERSHMGRTFSWELLLAKKDADADHIGKGVILDPDWVNLDLIKQWKNQCLSFHGDKCDNPLRVWRTKPAWLVDVKQKCIIPGLKADSFVALSYRWGDAIGVSMNDESLVKLQEPNALDDPAFAAFMNPMVRHAIHLTSLLEEQYVWVDRLCIIHGHDDTAEQLSLMGSIYASATITIVAADGVAEDGISGLRDVLHSRPRDLKQTRVPFGNELILGRNTSQFSMDSGTPYYERGWTYQEHMLARRKILFNQKEVHWECQCSQFHEELLPDAVLDIYIEPRLQEIMAGFPILDSLGLIVSHYNGRNLRYDEDALPGIRGLLAILSRSFTGGFLYGIPEMFFDRALGWEPSFGDTNLRRRDPSKRPKHEQLLSDSLPSWSWIGWQGLVEIGSEASEIDHRQWGLEETIPVTEWYTGHSPDTPRTSQRRIRSFWYENRELWKNPETALPAGWSRHTFDSEESIGSTEQYLWPDGCKDHVYRHNRYSGSILRPGDTWYFPFPVAEIDESTQPCMPEQTPYIFCKTQVVEVWTYRTSYGNMLSLHGRLGDQVGELHLHNEDHLQRFPTAEADRTGTLIKLISISLSYSHSKTRDKKTGKWGKPHFRESHYRVLWVEWQGNVAYRLASGLVNETKWESLQPQEIDVVLG